MGIEPTLPAWKAGTLPLSYTREAAARSGPGRPAGPRGAREAGGVRWVSSPSGRGIRRVRRTGRGCAAMGGAGFEPAKALPPDLQSGPFSHLGIHPDRLGPRDRMARAGGESRTHNRRFTKPVLCRLSYASGRRVVKFLSISPRGRDARIFPRSPPDRDEAARLPSANATAPRDRRQGGNRRSGAVGLAGRENGSTSRMWIMLPGPSAVRQGPSPGKSSPRRPLDFTAAAEVRDGRRLGEAAAPHAGPAPGRRAFRVASPPAGRIADLAA